MNDLGIAERPVADGDISATTSARIASRIRADIAAGVLAPGERIRIAALATRYGTSHLPVREALRIVEGERLVELVPHKGTTVRPITAKFIENVLDVRNQLEMYMIRRSAERITDAELEEISRRNAEFNEIAKTMDAQQIVKANGRLHDAMHEPADNPEAMQLLRSGFELIVAIRCTIGYTEKRLKEMCDEHNLIVEMLWRRNGDVAAELIRQHGIAAKRHLIDGLREQEGRD